LFECHAGSAPPHAITGARVSLTVTVNDLSTLFTRESVAEQVTVVVPRAKVEPVAGLHVTGTDPSSISIAVGGMYETGAPAGLVASAMVAPGTPVRVGGLSLTVTEKEPEPVLPAASCAVQVTVVLPIANTDPEAGLHVTSPAMPAASVAAAAG